MADFFSVQDISLCLGGRQILDHVSFSVDTPGRVIGLLGPNGGGKTTLLRAICGELPHDGHVFLEGAELAGLRSKELARRVSYIPQQSGISISMNALDVVLMGFYSRLKLFEQPSAKAAQPAVRGYESGGTPGSGTGRDGWSRRPGLSDAQRWRKAACDPGPDAGGRHEAAALRRAGQFAGSRK